MVLFSSQSVVDFIHFQIFYKSGFLSILYYYIIIYLCTTTTLGTQKLWPLLTGGRCSEIIYVLKDPIVTSK